MSAQPNAYLSLAGEDSGLITSMDYIVNSYLFSKNYL